MMDFCIDLVLINISHPGVEATVNTKGSNNFVQDSYKNNGQSSVYFDKYKNNFPINSVKLISSKADNVDDNLFGDDSKNTNLRNCLKNSRRKMDKPKKRKRAVVDDNESRCSSKLSSNDGDEKIGRRDEEVNENRKYKDKKEKTCERKLEVDQADCKDKTILSTNTLSDNKDDKRNQSNRIEPNDMKKVSEKSIELQNKTYPNRCSVSKNFPNGEAILNKNVTADSFKESQVNNSCKAKDSIKNNEKTQNENSPKIHGKACNDQAVSSSYHLEAEFKKEKGSKNITDISKNMATKQHKSNIEKSKINANFNENVAFLEENITNAPNSNDNYNPKYSQDANKNEDPHQKQLANNNENQSNTLQKNNNKNDNSNNSTKTTNSAKSNSKTSTNQSQGTTVHDLEAAMNKHLPASEMSLHSASHHHHFLNSGYFHPSVFGLPKGKSPSAIQWVSNGRLMEAGGPSSSYPVTDLSLLRSLYPGRESVIRSNIYTQRLPQQQSQQHHQLQHQDLQYYNIEPQQTLLTPPGNEAYNTYTKNNASNNFFHGYLNYNGLASNEAYSVTPPSSASPHETPTSNSIHSPFNEHPEHSTPSTPYFKDTSGYLKSHFRQMTSAVNYHPTYDSYYYHQTANYPYHSYPMSMYNQNMTASSTNNVNSYLEPMKNL